MQLVTRTTSHRSLMTSVSISLTTMRKSTMTKWCLELLANINRKLTPSEGSTTATVTVLFYNKTQLQFIFQTTCLGGRKPLNVKRGQKGPWPGLRDPLKCGALNANSSKTAKDTNLKFGRHVPRDSPDTTPDNSIRKVGVVRVTLIP